MLAIGSKAPDFKLRLDTGEIFRLRDLYGKNNVVISFFPDGLSNTETQDIYVFLQHLQKAQTLGAIVVTISPKNIGELQKLLALYNFTLPIASDPTLEVCRNYHAFWLRGLGLRKITYVIDKNGFIRGRLNHHLLTEKSWRLVMRLLQELAVKD
ncbi:MAG: redoxin domain-containing protein [Bacteroidota bacterium]|jgi:peroxiredoxin